VSARAVAIDTATERPEEFPAFRGFWIVRPIADAEELTLFALLDGPSLTGAYEFRVRPGDDTVVGVKADLYARRPIRKLGLCPLSSMYLLGELRLGRNGIDDFRPEVHDSDGLLLHTSQAEWLWRPLDNPPRLRISRFQDPSHPGGFGLLQRDRTYDHCPSPKRYAARLVRVRIPLPGPRRGDRKRRTVDTLRPSAVPGKTKVLMWRTEAVRREEWGVGRARWER
jgi:periplasmic glucans biosynthesis protein